AVEAPRPTEGELSAVAAICQLDRVARVRIEKPKIEDRIAVLYTAQRAIETITHGVVKRPRPRVVIIKDDVSRLVGPSVLRAADVHEVLSSPVHGQGQAGDVEQPTRAG